MATTYISTKIMTFFPDLQPTTDRSIDFRTDANHANEAKGSLVI